MPTIAPGVTRDASSVAFAMSLRKAMSSGENQYFSLSLVGAEGVAPAGVPSAGEPFAVRSGPRIGAVAEHLDHLRFDVAFDQFACFFTA